MSALRIIASCFIGISLPRTLQLLSKRADRLEELGPLMKGWLLVPLWLVGMAGLRGLIDARELGC